MKKFTIRLWVVLLFAFGMPILGIAQTDTYKYHSIFIYQFTKYIEWPTTSNQFIIGIWGDSPVKSELEHMAKTKSTPDRVFIIKKINNVSAIAQCKLVFLPLNRDKDLAKLIEAIGSKSILLVTEKEGAALRGSNMNLIFESGKLKMEMNKTKTLQNGFKVSSELIKFATIVA